MDLDLLDYLGASMLLSDKLTFLCKYREFHRLLESREFTAAGDLLVRLLVSNTVPHRWGGGGLPMFSSPVRPVLQVLDDSADGCSTIIRS